MSWDGRLRQVNLADGEDVAPAEKFIPGGGKPYALNLRDGVIYTATAQGCGGLPTRSILSISPRTRPAPSFPPAAACGAAAARRSTPKARVFLGTGDAQFDPPTQRLGNGIVGVKLDAKKQLQLVDFFRRPQCELAVAARSRREHHAGGVRHRKDGSSLSARARNAGCGCSIATRSAVKIIARHSTRRRSSATTRRRSTPAASGARSARGRIRTEPQWVLAPFWGPVSKDFHAPVEHARPKGGGVAAFKVQQRAGAWQLAPAWLSRDMDLAEEAVIANGVVFAYAAGEDASQTLPDKAWDEPGGPVYGGGLSSGPGRRVPTSRHATLYALDGTDRQGALVERQRDRIVEPLQRTDRRERPRLRGDLRRRALLLWRCAVGGESDARKPGKVFDHRPWWCRAGDERRVRPDRPHRHAVADGVRQRAAHVMGTHRRQDLGRGASKPGFELQWKAKLDNQPRGVHGPGQGVTATGVTFFVPMSLVTGSSNTIFGVDNDIGYVVWERNSTRSLPPATASCPGGITAAATRIVPLNDTSTIAPGFPGGRGAVGYRSLLGKPGEGVPVEGPAGAAARGRANDPAPPPAAGRGARGAAPGRRAREGTGSAGAKPAVVRSDPRVSPSRAIRNAAHGRRCRLRLPLQTVRCCVHDHERRHASRLGLPSGKDMQRPAQFLPANAKWSSPIAVGTTMYAATGGGCGGAPSAIWAIDLDSDPKRVCRGRRTADPLSAPWRSPPTGR